MCTGKNWKENKSTSFQKNHEVACSIFEKGIILQVAIRKEESKNRNHEENRSNKECEPLLLNPKVRSKLLQM